jgi:lipopolysaccharide biosynthesis regulator YciM
MGLALISKAQGKYSDAIASLRRLKQQDPKNYRIFVELADCCLKTGDKRGAVEALEEFQRQGIRNTHVGEMLEKL